jgi:hypothetical protein
MQDLERLQPQQRTKAGFTRHKSFNGIPNRQAALEYPYPPRIQRSPSVALSCTGSLRSESTVSTIQSTSSQSSRQLYNLEFYSKLALGIIPPSDVCIAAGKRYLAQVPLSMSQIKTHSMIHRNFFGPAKYEELQKYKADLKDLENARASQNAQYPQRPQVPIGDLIDDPSRMWFCRVEGCTYTEKKSTNTRGRMNHLKNSHHSMVKELMEFRQMQGEPHHLVSELFEKHSKEKSEAMFDPLSPEAKKRFARFLAEGIALSNLSFTILQSHFVKNIICYFNPKCEIPGASAVESALNEEYYALFLKAKKIIHESVALGSFTADTWTSQAGRKFLGLTFHYLTSDFTPRSVSIGFKAMPEQHTGEALKNCIGKVCVI